MDVGFRVQGLGLRVTGLVGSDSIKLYRDYMGYRADIGLYGDSMYLGTLFHQSFCYVWGASSLNPRAWALACVRNLEARYDATSRAQLQWIPVNICKPIAAALLLRTPKSHCLDNIPQWVIRIAETPEKIEENLDNFQGSQLQRRPENHIPEAPQTPAPAKISNS